MPGIPIVMSVDAVAGKAQDVLMGVVRSLEAIVSMTLEAARAGDVMSDAYSALTIPLEAARRATGGEVRDLDLLQTAARATAVGVHLTGESFATLSGFAKRFAEISGGDVRGAMDQMLSAMASGRTQSLKRLGFEIQEGSSKAEILAQVLEQIPSRMDAMGEGMDTAGDAVARMDESLANFSARVALGLTESQGFAASMGDVADMFERAAATGETLGIVLGILAGVIVDQFGEALSVVLQIDQAMGGFFQNLLRHAGGGVEHVSNAVNAARENRATRSGQEAFMADLIENGPQSGGFLAPLTPAEQNAFRRRQGRGGGGGGGGGGRQRFISPAEDMAAQGAFSFGNEDTAGLADAELEGLLGVPSDEQQDAALEDLTHFGEAKFDVMQAARDREVAAQHEHHVTMAILDKQAADNEARLQAARLDAAQGYISVFGGIAKQGAAQFGASKGALAWIEGIELTVQATAEWARSLVPYEGTAHIPGAIGLSAAAIFAFGKAAELGGDRKGSAGSGPSRGGGGGGLGSPAPMAGFMSPSDGGSAQNIEIKVEIQGQALHTKHEIAEAVMDHVVYAVDSGRKLPARGVGSR